MLQLALYLYIEYYILCVLFSLIYLKASFFVLKCIMYTCSEQQRARGSVSNQQETYW